MKKPNFVPSSPAHWRCKHPTSFRTRLATVIFSLAVSATSPATETPPDTPLSPRDPQVPAWENADHKTWEARRMATYAAQIDSMDQGLGRLIEALKRRGRFDNTVILFLSDNGSSDEVINGKKTRHGNFPQGGTRPDVMPGGPETYASGGKGWVNASNTPLRRYKKWTHEGGIATPLIVHWPSGISANGEIRRQEALRQRPHSHT